MLSTQLFFCVNWFYFFEGGGPEVIFSHRINLRECRLRLEIAFEFEEMGECSRMANLRESRHSIEISRQQQHCNN